MVQCMACKKFMSAKDGATCPQCKTKCHFACVGLPAGAIVAPTWRCGDCQMKLPKGRDSATPIRGRSDDYSMPSPSPVCTVNEADETELQLRMRIFREEFLAEFSGLRTSFTADMRQLTEEVRTLCSEMRDLRSEISDLRVSLNRSDEKIVHIEKRLIALEEARGNTCDVGEHGSLAKLESTVQTLAMELNDRDQFGLLNDVEITGLPENPGENPINIVSLLAIKIGVPLEERDIVSVERVGVAPTSRRSEHEVSPKEATPPGVAWLPRRLVVRFARRATRDMFLRAVRVRRVITTTDLEFPGPPVRIYLNERLTRINRQLFAKAREACRNKQWKYCWTRDCRVLVRRDQVSPTHRIRSINDLNLIFGVGTV